MSLSTKLVCYFCCKEMKEGKRRNAQTLRKNGKLKRRKGKIEEGAKKGGNRHKIKRICIMLMTVKKNIK